MKRGKAQAGIISTVLLILIVLISLTIVANIVIPLVREGANDVSIDIFTTQLEITQVKKFITGDVQVTVKQTLGDQPPQNLKFIFYDVDGTSKIIEKTTNLPALLETKLFYFNTTELNLSRPLKYISVVPTIGDKNGIEAKTNELLQTAYLPTQEVLAWWKFENDYADSSGNNNAGTSFGNPIFVDGRNRGKALQVDGVDDKIQAQSSLLTGTGDFTLSAVIYRVSGT